MNKKLHTVLASGLIGLLSLVNVQFVTAAPVEPVCPGVMYGERYLEFCAGESVTIGDTIVDGDCIVKEAMKTEGGCDSILFTTVHFVSPITIEREERFDGNAYTWNIPGRIPAASHTYMSEGVYYDTLRNARGCDSIYYRLVLYKEQPIRNIIEKTICKTETPYDWHGDLLYETCNRVYVTKTASGRDSIAELRLTVLPGIYQDVTLTMCPNTSIQYHGKTYTKSGLYNDTLRSEQGCDSVLRITVHVLKADTIITQASICDVEEYTWAANGQQYNTSGQYYIRAKNAQGCDSVQILDLHVWPTFRSDTTVIRCKKDGPFNWRGVNYANTGDYTDKFKSKHGCDSIYTLHLTMLTDTMVTRRIQLCEGSSYNFNGKTISGSGTHKDTLVRANGCDSIVVLQVEKMPRYYMVDTVDISNKDKYLWPVDNREYTAPGLYKKQFTTVGCGCDSVHALFLRVWPTYQMDTMAITCQTELPFIWRGRPYNSSGDYYEHLQTKQGYDSIYTLHLTVNKVDTEYVNLKLCKGDTLLFNGKKYTKGGHYQDADSCVRAYLINITEYIPQFYRTSAVFDGVHPYTWQYNGKDTLIFNPGVYYKYFRIPGSDCNDTYMLDLRKGSSFLSEETESICEGDEFVWRGRDLSRANVGMTTVYTDSFKTVAGLDSVYKLTLTVGRKYIVSQGVTICKGGSIEVNGRILDREGIYNDTLTTQTGCDSIIQTIVKLAPSYHVRDTFTLRAGETYIWHGKTITQAGLYVDQHSSVNGCDSTYELHVGILPIIRPEVQVIPTNRTTCEDEPYEWRGREYYAQGSYADTLKTEDGSKDSIIYVLNLTMYPKYRGVQHLYTCYGTSLTLPGGEEITESQWINYGKDSIEKTLQSIHGCDSIITYYLHFRAAQDVYDTLQFSNQESRIWHGREVKESGDYEYKELLPSGCYKTYHLHAIVDNVFIQTTDTAICETKAPFEWMGLTIPRVVGENNYSTTIGETLYKLHVTIWPVYEEERTLTICEGESISYGGITFDKDNTDADITLKSTGNCDSIIHVHVNVMEASHNTVTKYLKKGDSYRWRGKDRPCPGIYKETESNPNNDCDITYELVLKVLPEHLDEVTVCENELPYIWRGKGYGKNAMGDTIKEMSGDTMLYMLKLTVKPTYTNYKQLYICPGGSVQYAGKTYTKPTRDTIRLATVDLCDSLIVVDVFHTQDYHYTEHQYWSDDRVYNPLTDKWHNLDITGPGLYEDVNRTVNGCDSIYQLQVHPVKTTSLHFCEGQEISFGGHTYDAPTRDTLYYKTLNGVDSIVILVVSEHKAFHQNSVRYLREGDSIAWHGQLIKSPGTYLDGGQTAGGCDSIYSLEVRQLDEIRTVDRICQSEAPYEWAWEDQNGITCIDKLNTSGHWEHRIRDRYSNDSILYTLDLTVMPMFDTVINLTGCSNEEYPMFNGVTFDQSGTYYETLTTIDGCDSTFTLNVTIYDPIKIHRNDTVCENQLPYVFNLQEFWQEGEISSPREKSACGCDSTFSIRLTIAPTLTHNDSVIVCEDELPYILGDTNIMKLHPEYTGLPIYQDSVVWSCDHRYFFHVKVRQPIDVPVDICQSDSMMLSTGWFYAKNMTSNNMVIYDTLTTSQPEGMQNSRVQCDSVIRYIITRHEGYQYSKTVHIADTAHYKFHDRILTMSGTYYDTVPTVWGCDSIEELVLIVDKRYLFKENVHLCLPNSTVRDNKRDTAYEHTFADGHKMPMKIWNSGVYYDSLRTKITEFNYTDYDRAYKDSIYQLTVVFDTSYFIVRNYDLCRGDSVFLAGAWRTVPSTYTDSMETVLGCDSIIQWKVNYINNTYKFNIGRREVAEQHLPYVWTTYDAGQQNAHTQECWFSGEYQDTVKNMHGCDSILTMTLKVLPTTHKDSSIHYCSTDSITKFTFKFDDGHKIIVDTTGMYYDTLWAQLSMPPYTKYDSVLYVLDAHVHRVPTTYRDTTVCRGDSIMFDGQYIQTTGNSQLTYSKVMKALPTVNDTCHCDSVVEWTIRLADNYYVDEGVVKIGRDSSYVWHQNGQDFIINSAGDYYDKNETMYGCDSTYKVTVEVYPTYRLIDSVTICQNELPYYYGANREKAYTQLGETVDSIRYQTKQGFDSIHVLYLNVLPVQKKYVNVNICQGESFTTKDNKIITRDGQYSDTLRNTMTDCDSIVIYNVTVTPRLQNEYSREITDKDSVKFFDKWVNQPGTYQHVDTAQCGCDSLVTTLHLTVWPSYSKDTTIRMCENELPLKWQDYTINKLCKDSTIVRRYTTVHNADSIFTLHLTVLPVKRTTMSRTLCQGDEFTMYDGRKITQSGLYYDTLGTAFGCDSIVAVSLYFTPVRNDEYSREITDKDSVKFFGKWLNQPGTYQHVDTAQCGCDSLITTLHLSVWPSYSKDTTIRMCENELPLRWQDYTINKLCKDSTIVRKYTTIHNADSIFTLHLTVLPVKRTTMSRTLCQGDEFTMYDGRKITQSGLYYDTLGTAFGCDSIVAVSLYFTPVRNDEYSREITDKDSVKFFGKWLNQPGTYQHVDTAQCGCDSLITTLHLSVWPSYSQEDYKTICETELPFKWEGYVVSRVVSDTLLTRRYSTIHHADSIKQLHLSVLPITRSETTLSICEGDSVMLGGAWRKIGGRYVDTLTSRINGCDSIRTTLLTLIPTQRTERVVLLCEGDTYVDMFGVAHPDCKGGNYNDTISSLVTGCDSIITSHVVYRPVRYEQVIKTISDQESYNFIGNDLTQAGHYEFSTKYEGTDCDSIISTLDLTVAPTYRYVDSVAICENELPYEWQGEKKYDQTGIYTKRYNTTMGYDSIYTLKLTVLPTHTSIRQINLCQGETYTLFNGTVVTRGGRYNDTISSMMNGCDSIITLDIRFSQAYAVEHSYVLPEDSVMDFYGQRVANDGTYVHYGQTAAGCDSIVTIHVSYLHTYFIKERAEVCPEDLPFNWNGRQYYQSTVDTLRRKSILGQDSLVELNLLVYEPIPVQTRHIGLCKGDTFQINSDIVVVQEGVYYDTVRSMNGCDSITKFIVNYYPTFNRYYEQTICHGEYVEFNGRKLTETGDYYARLKTMNGCDSIVHLHLTVKDAFIYESTDLITPDQLPYLHDGVLYRDSGTYETIFATKNGCDSIYRYTLRLTEKVSEWHTLYLCGKQDSSLVINGQVITQPGEYQFERRSKSAGIMDSLYRVNVVMSYPYEYSISRTICQDTFVTIGKHNFNVTGQYTIRLESQEGCDSIIHLDLTVNPSYDLHQKMTVIDYNTPYMWQGKPYRYTGIYHEEYSTMAGCDSVLTLDLTVVETQYYRDTVKICIDDLPYYWSRTKKNYYEDGLYTDTVYANGESKIYSVDLRVIKPTIVTYMPSQQVVCADQSQFTLDFTYTGGTPEVYNLYFDNRAQGQGFINVIGEPYNDGIVVHVPQFEGSYVRPDYYNMQLLLDNGICDRTLYDVTLLVKYPSWVMEQNWSNTVSILSHDYNGGYTFNGYRWYIDGVLQPNEISAHLTDNTLHAGSQVMVELQRQGESYYIPSCEIVMEKTDDSINGTPVLVVNPNTVSKVCPNVRMHTEEPVEYRLVSQNGQVLSQGRLDEGDTDITLPNVSGCYFVWALTQEGESTTQKIIVY